MNKTTVARLGRNEPCRCGSGRKYKQCCLDKDESDARAAFAKALAEAPASSPDAGRVSRRAPKHQTQQPWKATNMRGAHQRVRTPRKVGGS
jgi:SEC-C motif